MPWKLIRYVRKQKTAKTCQIAMMKSVFSFSSEIWMWFTNLKFVKLQQWNEWPYSCRSNKNEWTKIDQDKKDFASRMDSRLFQSCGWGFVNSWCQCFVSQKQSFHGSGFFYQIDSAHLDLTQNLSPESGSDNNYFCVTFVPNWAKS